jgi:hypothetical protein
MRLLALGITMGMALAVAIGVLYDRHASGSRMLIHVAVAAFALGLVGVLAGLAGIFILGIRGNDFPPKDPKD